MRIPAMAVLAALCLANGCATGTGSPSLRSPGSSRDRISPEELEPLPPGTVFNAVERLRPIWLRGRSATIRTETGRTFPVVFLDDQRLGGLETLHQVSTESVEEILFISPADATLRYGTGYPGGIIQIRTKR